MSPDAARDTLVHAALAFAASRAWTDLHPDDPHGGDEMDLRADQLADAATAYVATLANEASDSWPRTAQAVLDGRERERLAELDG